MNELLNKISTYIHDQQLLEKDNLLLVALSGGADSVALLLLLSEMGYRVEACHCNFHLRGEESDRDEHFCKQLCMQHQIPFHCIHFDTREYAQLHKMSIEMAARELRYHYFEQLRKDIKADYVCVAHHKDDSVETMLINIVRGTGLNGLKGILPKNHHIIRPLLCITREEILLFLQDVNQKYVTDSSNLIDDVIRNKIRIHILPQLKAINPSVTDNLARLSEYTQEAYKIIEATLDGIAHWEEGEQYLLVDKKKVLACPSSEYALFHTLSPYGFHGHYIHEILTGIDKVGKTWTSNTHMLVIDREYILVREKRDTSQSKISYKIPEIGNYYFEKDICIHLSYQTKTAEFTPSKANNAVTLDADKVKFPLQLRKVRQGDRFQPFGMRGSKLVSDFLTNKKYNLFEKENAWVLTDKDGEIIWLIGERTAENTKVENSTLNILKIVWSSRTETKFPIRNT